MQPTLPKLYTRLFKAFCKPQLYQELQGDLEEEFNFNIKELGEKKAKAIYRKEVMKMIRPSVLNINLMPSFINRSLFWHFFKISFRNIKRNLAYSTLNILGFAAALAVCLFCINAIYSNHQLDKKFSDGDRIYRVNLELKDERFGNITSATTQIPLYNKLLEALPEAEAVTFIQKDVISIIAQLKGAKRSLQGSTVNKQFFDVFDYEMVLGNANDLFKNPKNIIITEELMHRYFEPEKVIGSRIGDFLISGVIENPSKVSHLDFEFLIADFKDQNSSAFYASWNVYFFQQLYVKILPEGKLPFIKEKLQSLSSEINSELENGNKGINYSFFLEPLAEVAQSRAYFNSTEMLDSKGQKLLVGLMIILLSIAIFNYTNLAMASAIARTKEVGVRKVMGSKKSSLIYQFIVETSILAMAGFLLGLLIFKLLAPGFASFSEFAFEDTLSFNQVALFFAFTLATALISGVLPGLFFSNISILRLFKRGSSKNNFSFGYVKKVLIVVQVSLSLLVFTMGFLLVNQSHLIINQKSTFSGENIIGLDLPTADSLNTIFRTELQGISGVESVASLEVLPYSIDSRTYVIKTFHAQESKENYASILHYSDSGFASTFNQSITWLGSKQAQANQPYFLVNRAFEEQLNDSIKTIREGLYSTGGDYYPVLGIVEDLNLGEVMNEISPAAFLIVDNYNYTSVAIRVNEANFKSTLTKIEHSFQSQYPDESFYPLFFDDILQERLSQFKNIINAFIFVFCSIIAITLMGQIGMAMFQAQTKEKEIGVRKVLGASFNQITGLLLKSTFVQLIIAGIIACPLAYLIFREIIPNFSIPLTLKLYHFIGAFLLFAILITILVSSQTWKVANRNPTESLKSE
jgi:putative ABC transport system permease protein